MIGIGNNAGKRAALLALCCITMVSLLGLTACGEKDLYDGLDPADYIKVGEYKGVKADEMEAVVTKAEIGDVIVEELKAAAKETNLKKGDAVKEGDTVNIDYTGKVNGKKFEGGTAKGQDLVLGSGTYIDGFEEGLIGHKVGEENIELKLAFPPNYSEEKLQGKDVVFTVTINGATRSVQPEYNDAFVKTLGDFKQKKAEAEENVKMEIWSKVLADTKVIKYPKEVVDHYIEMYNELTDYNAEQYGLDRKDFIGEYYGAATEQDLQKQLKDYAQTLVKQELLVEYIASKESITYTDDEAETLRKDIEGQGYTEESVLRETGRTMEQYVHIELLYEKVLNYLKENANIQ